jgi:aspartyl-tRNA(Asn)/glutamyl-tRNA(Gln) amidotransferase subunit A
MTGPVEARVRAVLERIAAENARTRIFLDLDAAVALAAARAADAGGGGALAGVTVAVKANIAMRGLPWSAGIAGWRDRVADRDAGVVARLRAAGAVILGTVNMDEGALGAVCDNPAFGRCLNPLGEGLTPGGSSGGSGAAVAAGLADLALGTDTMGSVRIPAAYCGVAGLKPTRGLVGRSGLAYLCPTLDTIGPLTARVADLGPALSVLAGPDAGDPESRGAPFLPEVQLAGIRLILPAEVAGMELEPEVRAALAWAVGAVRDLGATVEEAPMDGWNPGAARRAGLLLAEAEGAAEMAGLLATPGALSDALAGALAYGRDAPSGKLAGALARLRAAAGAALRALDGADGLILPTAPQRAFAHGNPVPANQADLTAMANIAGLPAVAIPVPVPGGLPASVQIMGPAFADLRLIGWGAALQVALQA